MPQIADMRKQIKYLLSAFIVSLSVLMAFADTQKQKMKHFEGHKARQSNKISNDQELIQSDPISCPQNQKGNN